MYILQQITFGVMCFTTPTQQIYLKLGNTRFTVTSQLWQHTDEVCGAVNMMKLDLMSNADTKTDRFNS